MKIKHRSKSLSKKLYTISILIIIYMLINLAINYSIHHRANIQFNQLMDRNENITALATNQHQLKLQLDICLSEPIPENLFVLNSLNNSITSIVDSLKMKSSGREETLIHLRVIQNMLNYEIDSTTGLLPKTNKTEEDYREINFLHLLMNSMNEEIQDLLVFETGKNTEAFQEYSKISEQGVRFSSLIQITLITILSAVVLLNMKEILNQIGLLISLTHSSYCGEQEKKTITHSEFIELEELTQAFNKMNLDIQNYIDQIQEKSRLEIKLQNQYLENERKDKLLHQARLDFLQSQINPHFLFNALNVIGKLSVLNNPELSLELIESISQILRYSLDHKSEQVMISQEIEILNAYLKIQKIRYMDRLDYKITSDESLQMHTLPAMIIQPLVENSIKYGLHTDQKSLCVHIDFRETQGGFTVMIRDNGPGFSKERIKNSESLGIGLSNVRDRLRLFYGQDDHMTIEASPNVGTIIEIHIPLTPMSHESC